MTIDDWLGQAIDLAVKNVSDQGGPFGAVVVRDGEVIGEGTNRVTATLDPTAHAEVVAIRDACRRTGEFALTGAVLYASCEPCPLCLAASLWARVDHVVFAATREDAAAAGFDDARFHRALTAKPEAWADTLEHRDHPRSGDPFAAWHADASRVPY
ncbi:nucleoside deaminase [Aeromicrobium terrae]|uniref:Nucleoside deaminase n=1 Tax=Aeromicrobium terrae TaxID=2498846 RepID=A0A5C8NJE3_9ACTN|nr:nucleoside deaminase [Aeromicrobium terrae]TXL61342.1 nucleoside deaminase [Aeromicrobium terrae]